MIEDPLHVLRERFAIALGRAFGEEFGHVDPLIRPATNPQFGDFQANVAMSLAKPLGRKPREIATDLVDALEIDDLCDEPEIAGPGFINLRLRADALARMVESMDDPRLGVEPKRHAGQVVIDLVGVNIAKSMHVGHLRSSIIGDALVRLLRRVGHDVLPQNHLGDWGLQIAMVLAALRDSGIDLEALSVDELERAYRAATLAAKADIKALETARRLGAGPHRMAAWEAQVAGAEAAQARARETLVRLQAGDPELVADWNRITAITLASCYEVWDLLDLVVTSEHNCGESFYRDRLPAVVNDLLEAGIAEESEGAIVVRFEDSETPLIIRKRDGGYLYATTDLAAVRYRVQELGAERLIYVVDARQRDHFRMVFETARRAGWHRPPGRGEGEAEMVHVAFGAVCGEDGRPLKTRSGDNVKLRDLLDEAIRRAAAVVAEKNPDLPAEEQAGVARAVGVGCVKYADLSSQIARDYVFSWDRMLAFEGNTAAFLQNQYVRIRSIGRKAPAGTDLSAPFVLEDPAEKALALALLRYPGTIDMVQRDLEPSRLCQYLYDLAVAFSGFYSSCPILKAEPESRRDGRLRLAELTARVLADGLGLLGIRTLERM